MKLSPSFFFSEEFPSASIYVSKVFSTYSMTLTDLVDSVITCQTSRSSGVVGGSKKKSSALAMEVIMSKIISILKDHLINRLEVVVCFRSNSAIYYMFSELELASILVWSVIRSSKMAHNGVRLPKKSSK